jgi:hypothetical protein
MNSLTYGNSTEELWISRVHVYTVSTQLQGLPARAGQSLDRSQKPRWPSSEDPLVSGASGSVELSTPHQSRAAVQYINRAHAPLDSLQWINQFELLMS